MKKGEASLPPWIAAGLWALCLLAASCGPSAPPPPPAAGEPAERYWAVQLHLHGSFSEGPGTMAGQTAAARRLGAVDVLWWTDHDWRIARHTFVSSFGFETLRQRLEIPHRGTPWSKRPRHIRVSWLRQGGGKPLGSEDQSLVATAVEGQSSLRLSAEAEPDQTVWAWTGGVLEANGGRWARPLAASVVLELALRPETRLGPDAQLVVRLELSRQDRGPVELRYVVGADGEPRSEMVEGRLAGIRTRTAEPGRWTVLRLPVTRDATELGLGGEDNSLRRIEIRLQVRRGARAAVLVDDLELSEELDGPALLERQQALAAQLERETGIVQHVGLELSYALHMNAYLPRPELPDFDRFPHGMEPGDTLRWVHERGGVVGYNHVFGAGDDPEDDVKEALASRGDQVVRERAYGADLLEVGYPLRVLPLADHLAVWDRLSDAGVVITGIGTSDSHDSVEGWNDGNDFVTWIWATGTEAPALIEGLRCGRVFFGDPARFAGGLELTAGGSPVTGRIVHLEEGETLTLHGNATSLPPESRVRWVVDGQVVREDAPPAGPYASELEVRGGAAHFVRLEVWQAERGLAFTNPVYLEAEGARPLLASGAEPPPCRRGPGGLGATSLEIAPPDPELPP